MSKRKDRYEFIWQSIQIYGYKDDYREVNYKNSNTKVKILCPIHGEFLITPNDYLNGHRCRKCFEKKASNLYSKPFEYYKEKLNNFYKNEDGTPKFNMDEINYTGYNDKFELTCPIHGKFTTTMHMLMRLKGLGCPQCNLEERNNSQKLGKNTFIKKSNDIFNSKYIYDNVNYINSKTKVCIICPEHGEFWMTPNEHLSGKGCPICGKLSRIEKQKMTKDEFIEKAKKMHLNEDLTPKYIYDEIDFIDGKTKVKIICPEHGEFFVSPTMHLQGVGCKECAIKKRAKLKKMTYEKFLKKFKEIYKDNYEIISVGENILKDEIIIKCKKHGLITTNYSSLIYNRCGCIKCRTSSLENTTMKFLEDKNINYIFQCKNNILPFLKIGTYNTLSLDFYLPDYNVAIECQGRQHFEPVEKFGGEEAFKNQVERDLIKSKLCDENNIKLIYINYFDKKEIITEKINEIIKL